MYAYAPASPKAEITKNQVRCLPYRLSEIIRVIRMRNVSTAQECQRNFNEKVKKKKKICRVSTPATIAPWLTSV